MSPKRAPAILVLEDGRVFEGEAFGAVGETFGEAVFATGMTGYQETLTDPSYHRQVVVQTTAHIGNTGVNAADEESRRIWVAGYVIHSAARVVSNWRATRGLEDELAVQGVVGICEVDTRALTRHLRSGGAMRCGISSLDTDPKALLAKVKASPSMAGANLLDEVTCAEPYVVPANGQRRFTVAALDFGIKRNTPRRMAERGIETHVLPASSTFDDIAAVNADAVFLSNGPGDPATADHQVAVLRELLARRIPVFGICFGNQILGRALGLSTFKLKFGHRGINQPVRDETTRKVEITAHNHGFAVGLPSREHEHSAVGPPAGETAAGAEFDTEFGRARVSHICLNDNVVEGLSCMDIPAFSVQYHPEAAAGPHDADYLFDRLTEMIGDNISA
ncbi:MAG TPA: glutamine-hydrolyzing carbamoyl-phosphate synthase small subunit [Stackebrandtia sp.]|uniref:glutamine-hydrolyzing carbamoyl-phosphate synthase small subunit n=1 Tax=Stackebrandtia sp. TaxID=2023065 RepID=UPI002D5D898D|nr:glutamine-hydrolyzing carbamoyl-phosphate synthase small subunit [Stackebrandtia sp.]HZE39825.1 glutamine-hydrolyzing carbamoyl-phosphate synthase small subunit [Stackebrandtia sp.]